ncbi:hypothetical protein M9H77_28779 [Catharanthus roseus]|uniref:Uncharacterized protein n=1 Tax=Catharanthus roseus TaxID=4058 RepID=A0ACC0AKF8_CATRO|nr:hypothetical protein M9H77_28779 [Catharanthus roseus]
MKVVALVSGGKDSCYAMMKCIQYGHEIVALANLLPADDAEDELDSYMYQTVGHQIVVSYAKCMGLPLFRRRIKGSTRHQGLNYSTTPGDEVEDMFILLNEVKRKIPSVGAVSSGAIASDYQRLRVESVCSRLGLVSLAYLWKQDQSLLLQDMIKNGIVAITVKVAAMGLHPSKHVGKEISFLECYLHKLKEQYGINVCGEGGEYETLTLDCPLFKNARIVLDDFEVVFHSSDPICPVGILHPLAFHLEEKQDTASSIESNKSNGICLEEPDMVTEVLGDCQSIHEVTRTTSGFTSTLSKADEVKLHISKAKKENMFSISCWLQDPHNTAAGEMYFYIHLYIADMNKFAIANETYVRFITQDKCCFGVPSRSTIELPLLQAGLGTANVEVLVADDHTKKVLHVQSISCWAPSCIGPYSQATLHKDILYMAGQLGLDPPTMLLSSGGPTSELVQALENSEAVAKCFGCSITTSAILFIVYCSIAINELDRSAVENKTNIFLKEKKQNNSDGGRLPDVVDPMFLYVLVPDLPKRAFVEVKPMLYTGVNTETLADNAVAGSSKEPGYWGFQPESWHYECIQKYIVPGRLCAAILSIKENHAAKICSTLQQGHNDEEKENFLEEQMERTAKFCFYLLDVVLSVHQFNWNDVTTLRIYVPPNLEISYKTLSLIFNSVFKEFAEMSKNTRRIGNESIFNIVPVVGAGRSATSMDDKITCELFSIKT